MQIKKHRPGDGSTGPKTQQGRERCSRNATSHGARSEQHIILPTESAEEYAQLCHDWEQEFTPANNIEAAMLQRLCERDWHLRRCDRLCHEAMTKTLLKQPDPSNWSAEDHKYIQLMERYRHSADRAYKSARRDIENLRDYRLQTLAQTEKLMRAIFNNRRDNIGVTKSEKNPHVEAEFEEKLEAEFEEEQLPQPQTRGNPDSDREPDDLRSPEPIRE